MLKKIKNQKEVFQLVVYVVMVMTFLIVNTIERGGYDIRCKWDDYIAFIPIFVIPYFLWYLYILVVGFVFYMKSKNDLRKMLLMVNICMAIAVIIYIVFPNYQSLRPTAYASGFFSQWVRLLQQGDSPSSVCPSLHVAVSVVLYYAVANSVCFKDNFKIKTSALFLTILISISTVFIKQHSIVDVVFGFLLGVVAYVFVYKFYCNEKLVSNPIAQQSKESASCEQN
jgi:membrane-associated phospholipid phosphatase